MRILAKIVIVFWVVMCSNQIADAASAITSDIYLNKNYWERMMWQRADTSELWRAKDWLPFDGKQAKTYTLTKTKKLVLFGKQFDARLGYNNDKIENKFFAALSGKVSRNDCTGILKELTSIFGQPIMHDGTFIPFFYSEKNYMKLVELDYQWDIGDTRIDAGCFGSVTQDTESQMDKPELILSLNYAHTSARQKLVPKFALRCTQKFEFLDQPGSVREMPDLVIWVDTRTEHVTNASNIPISDINTFHATDRQINFKVTGAKKMVTEYALDRVTGSLSAEVSNESNPNTLVARISGKCDKTDTIEKKF